jgi:tetratricopeptide (TPR) repeat protein
MRVIKRDPKSSGRYIIRALFKADNLKDYKGALADYDRAIQMSPQWPEHYIDRARFKDEKLFDYKGALADYELALRKCPDTDKYYLYLMRLQVKFRHKDYKSGDLDCSRALRFASNANEVSDVKAICGYFKYRMSPLQPFQ